MQKKYSLVSWLIEFDRWRKICCVVCETCVRARMCETCICGRVHCGMMRYVYGGKMMSVCMLVHAPCYH